MAVIVGFSGPSGSGKTTLVNRLSRLYSSHLRVEVIPEMARVVFQEWRDRGYKSLTEIRKEDSIRFQKEVLKRQLEAEVEAIKSSDLVLVDRTIYDNLFFTVCFNGGDWRGLEEYIQLFKNCETQTIGYDLIFFCKPVNGPHLDDGFRTPDLNYKRFQEFVIKRLIPRYTNVVELDGDLSRRLEISKQHIKEELELRGTIGQRFQKNVPGFFCQECGSLSFHFLRLRFRSICICPDCLRKMLPTIAEDLKLYN